MSYFTYTDLIGSLLDLNLVDPGSYDPKACQYFCMQCVLFKIFSVLVCLDCVLEWGDFGSCINGEMTRRQFVAQNLVGAGSPCPAPQTETQGKRLPRLNLL